MLQSINFFRPRHWKLWFDPCLVKLMKSDKGQWASIEEFTHFSVSSFWSNDLSGKTI